MMGQKHLKLAFISSAGDNGVIEPRIARRHFRQWPAAPEATSVGEEAITSQDIRAAGLITARDFRQVGRLRPEPH